MDGEVCPLVVAELERLYLGKDYKVVPHKVNESGSSSKLSIMWYIVRNDYCDYG